jgi:hypothetical protein
VPRHVSHIPRPLAYSEREGPPILANAAFPQARWAVRFFSNVWIPHAISSPLDGESPLLLCQRAASGWRKYPQGSVSGLDEPGGHRRRLAAGGHVCLSKTWVALLPCH